MESALNRKVQLRVADGGRYDEAAQRQHSHVVDGQVFQSFGHGLAQEGHPQLEYSIYDILRYLRVH